MWELFPSRDLSYQLRKGSTKLIIPPIKKKSYGINSFIFRGSILWNSIPNSIKNSSSLEIFKNAIKTRKAELSFFQEINFRFSKHPIDFIKKRIIVHFRITINDNEIVIKIADKGGAAVVMSTSHYKNTVYYQYTYPEFLNYAKIGVTHFCGKKASYSNTLSASLLIFKISHPLEKKKCIF